MKKITEVDTWFICRNEDLSVIHYLPVEANKEIGTGQPVVEEFYNEADWLARLLELGITPE